MQDSELIENILNGKTQYFEVLIDKYQPAVFLTAIGFVHVKEDAEDIVQEVFVKVYQSLAGFKGDASFSTWLYRITVNVSLNHLNRNKFRLLIGFTDNLLHHENRYSEDLNPADEIIGNENARIIRKAIDSLPDKQRTAFVLSKYEDMPQKQIAEILQVTEGAVEQLLQRAKQSLQKKLKHLVGK
ncbi:MAG: RNA polymerase sigma factor [Paludibacter sp.]|nr:RNA polymerase sigma factor [Paludibacter sp.]